MPDANDDGDAVLRDQTTVHVVMRLPRTPQTIAFVRDLVRDSLALAGATGQMNNDICVAVTEACANVVEHVVTVTGYDVTIDVSPDRFTATVTDQGQGITEHAATATMPGPEAVRGRGVPLMRALMDEAIFTIQPDIGTTVKLVKILSAGVATVS